MDNLIKSGIRKLVYKLPDGNQYTIISLENYNNASVPDTIRAFKFASEQVKFEDYYQGINPTEEERWKYMHKVALSPWIYVRLRSSLSKAGRCSLWIHQAALQVFQSWQLYGG